MIEFPPPVALAEFWVPGKPQTKGSLTPDVRRTGEGTLKVSVRDKRATRLWMMKIISTVKEAGHERRRVDAWPGPVVVYAMYYFERLCAADAAMPYPTRESGMYAHGDGDKLERALWDALKYAYVITDDSNVVGWSGAKRWAGDRGPGVEFQVMAVMPARDSEDLA